MATPIENQRLRKQTFSKRTQGVKKKIHELTTLCDLEACLVAFGSDGEVATWPEDESKLHQIIQRYTNLGKKQRDKYKVETSEATTKMTNSEEHQQVYVDPTTGKRLDELSEESLRELNNLVCNKLDKVRKRMKGLKNDQSIVEENKENQPQPQPPIDNQTVLYNPQPIFLFAGPPSALGDVNGRSSWAAKLDEQMIPHPQPKPVEATIPHPALTQLNPMSGFWPMSMPPPPQSMPIFGFQAPPPPPHYMPMCFGFQPQQQVDLNSSGATHSDLSLSLSISN